MYTIVSTRFTNQTWSENINYRLNNNITGCIYGSPQELSPKILIDSYVFVVEMNNTTNCIEGIGFIQNRSFLDKYYRIYEIGNYNRYVYKGKYRINREQLIRYNESLVRILDYILFKEKTHLKRGSGFTTIPEKLFNHNICKDVNIKNEIKNVFVSLFCDKEDSIEEMNNIN